MTDAGKIACSDGTFGHILVPASEPSVLRCVDCELEVTVVDPSPAFEAAMRRTWAS